MKHTDRLSVLLVVALGLTAGCDSDAKALSLGGRLSSLFSTAQRSSALAPGSAEVVLPPVDLIAAVPHFHGAAQLEGTLTAAVVPGGSFSLSLEKTRDYVVFLLRSAAPLPQRIAGYVTVGSGPESMLVYPFTAATGSVDVGEVQPPADGRGDAPGDQSIRKVAKSFDLQLDTILALAANDNAYKSIGNALINNDTVSGVRYELEQSYQFANDLQRLSKDSTPDDYAFIGAAISIRTNDTRIDFDAICAGTARIEVVPPVSFRDALGDEWSPSSPMYSVDCMVEQPHGIRVTRRIDDGRIEVGLRTIKEIPAGYFQVLYQGDLVAAFDLGLASPWVDGKLGVPAAVPRLTMAADGSIERVDAAWYGLDASGKLTPAQDTTYLERLIGTPGLHLWGAEGGFKGENSDSNATNLSTQWTPTRRWTLTEQPPETRVHMLRTSYGHGGASYNFDWTVEEFCGNGSIGKDEVCDGPELGGATCESLGYKAGTLACSATCDVLDTNPCPQTITGKWSAAGTMAVARVQPLMVRLDDGRVLLTGGKDAAGLPLASSDLYDPTTNTITPTGALAQARASATATLLADGRVLVAGGLIDQAGATTTATVELYDPTAGTFTTVAPMATARAQHTATALADGRVLIAGGASTKDGQGIASTEFFDPTALTFAAGPTLGKARREHTATLTGDATQGWFVVLIGGADGTTALDSIESWSAGNGAWQGGATLQHPRFAHRAAVLPSGGILLTGGLRFDSASQKNVVVAWFEEVWQPKQVARLDAAPLSAHTATALPAGHVLAYGTTEALCDVGGKSLPCPPTKIYYPAAQRWEPAGADRAVLRMGTDRVYHDAVALDDGVLACGGKSGNTALNSCERFTVAP